MNEDFTDQYNTPLSKEEETQFQGWVTQMSKKTGRDYSQDLYDYDLRGFWKSKGTASDSGHLTDTYKKPNHPTFSTESKYHGVDGYTGGKWLDRGNDKWDYQASPTNLQFYNPEHLQMYFKTVEPNSNLIIPK